MRNLKKIIAFFLMVLMLVSVMPVLDGNSEVKADLIYLNYGSCEMTAGKQLQLKVMGTTSKVVWKSSNKKVATVKKGKVTGIKKGKCTITAKVNGQILKCKITVTGGEIVTKFKEPTLDVLDLKIDMHKITYDSIGAPLLTDEADTFKLQLLNKPKGKIKWSSTKKSVATVNKGAVTAAGVGECTIVAKVKKKKYKCKVVVTDYKDPVKIESQENIYLMLQLMNRDRVKVKSRPLRIKEELNKVADVRVSELPVALSHTRPNGTAYSTVYDEIGFKKGTVIGENVAYYSDKVPYMGAFVNQSYKSLFESEEHKANILNPTYKYLGLGYKNAGNWFDEYGALFVSTYWVQEFYTE